MTRQIVAAIGSDAASARAQIAALGPSLEGGPAPAIGEVLTWDGSAWVPAAGGGGGGVTSVGASGPLASSGGLTPDISIVNGVSIGDIIRWSGTKWVVYSPTAPVTSVGAASPLASSGGTTPSISLTAGTLPNDVLTWNGAAWAAAAWNLSAINQLTGDVTAGPGTGSQAATVKAFGGKIHWVVIGGNYASLQAAVTAAAANDLIIVGPSSSTWGDVTFPALKPLSVIGLGPQHASEIAIGKVTFSPSSGGTADDNEIWLCNLYISGTFVGAQGLLFSGTAPARLKLQGCFISNAGLSGDGVVVNNSGVGSSAYLDKCLFHAVGGNVTSTQVNHLQGYSRITGTDISDGLYAVACAAGQVDLSDVRMEYVVAGAVVNITGGTVAAQNVFVQNTTAGGSGLALAGTSVLILNNSVLDIAVGAGYCVRGVGGFLYGQISYTNNALLARNVKVQNTLTALPITQAYTLAP